MKKKLENGRTENLVEGKWMKFVSSIEISIKTDVKQKEEIMIFILDKEKSSKIRNKSQPRYKSHYWKRSLLTKISS